MLKKSKPIYARPFVPADALVTEPGWSMVAATPRLGSP
jgi:hypothetical protein